MADLNFCSEKICAALRHAYCVQKDKTLLGKYGGGPELFYYELKDNDHYFVRVARTYGESVSHPEWTPEVIDLWVRSTTWGMDGVVPFLGGFYCEGEAVAILARVDRFTRLLEASAPTLDWPDLFSQLAAVYMELTKRHIFCVGSAPQDLSYRLEGSRGVKIYLREFRDASIAPVWVPVQQTLLPAFDFEHEWTLALEAYAFEETTSVSSTAAAFVTATWEHMPAAFQAFLLYGVIGNVLSWQEFSARLKTFELAPGEVSRTTWASLRAVLERARRVTSSHIVRHLNQVFKTVQVYEGTLTSTTESMSVHGVRDMKMSKHDRALLVRSLRKLPRSDLCELLLNPECWQYLPRAGFQDWDTVVGLAALVLATPVSVAHLLFGVWALRWSLDLSVDLSSNSHPSTT